MLTHDLDRDAGGGRDALGVIGAVREGRPDERPEAAGCLEERASPVPILNVGRMGARVSRRGGGRYWVPLGADPEQGEGLLLDGRRPGVDRQRARTLERRLERAHAFLPTPGGSSERVVA